MQKRGEKLSSAEDVTLKGFSEKKKPAFRASQVSYSTRKGIGFRRAQQRKGKLVIERGQRDVHLERAMYPKRGARGTRARRSTNALMGRSIFSRGS